MVTYGKCKCSMTPYYTAPMVVSEYVFVFEYRIVVCLYWKAHTHGGKCMYLYFIFGLYLQTHMYTVFTHNGMYIASHRLKIQDRMFFHSCGRVNCGQAALRKLAYTKAAG